MTERDSNDFTARCFEQERVSRLMAIVEEFNEYIYDLDTLANIHKQNHSRQVSNVATQALNESARCIKRRIPSLVVLQEEDLADAISNLINAIDAKAMGIDVGVDISEEAKKDAAYNGNMPPFELPSNYEELEEKVFKALSKSISKNYSNTDNS